MRGMDSSVKCPRRRSSSVNGKGAQPGSHGPVGGKLEFGSRRPPKCRLANSARGIKTSYLPRAVIECSPRRVVRQLGR